MPTSGHTLRLERVRARLSMKAVAAQLGVSRQTLWTVEMAAQVAADRAKAYRAAVKTLSDAKETAA